MNQFSLFEAVSQVIPLYFNYSVELVIVANVIALLTLNSL